jgi:hypothetical protein
VARINLAGSAAGGVVGSGAWVGGGAVGAGAWVGSGVLPHPTRMPANNTRTLNRVHILFDIFPPRFF